MVPTGNFSEFQLFVNRRFRHRIRVKTYFASTGGVKVIKVPTVEEIIFSILPYVTLRVDGFCALHFDILSLYNLYPLLAVME